MRDVDHQRSGSSLQLLAILQQAGIECALCHDPLGEQDEGFDFCQKCRSDGDD
jgi:hypothetical protein